MRRGRLIPALLAGAALAAGACASASVPHRLLVPVYFYQGHSVGRADRETGLHAGDGEGFRALTWPELIASSVAADGTGRFLALACGNGVLASRDAGRSWRLTGGWEMTEVQKVALDPRDPGRAFAATAYGLWRAGDLFAPVNPWSECAPEAGLGFLSDVLIDDDRPDALWVCGERGVFRSVDGGRTFAEVLGGVRVKRLARAGANPSRVLAATDGRGLLEVSGDGSVRRIEGPPDVLFSVALDPRDPGTVFCGSKVGLAVSRDGGATWSVSREGMPEDFHVYGIAADPDREGRVLVGGNDGVLESLDGGRSFARLSFESALVPDLAFAPAPEGPRDGPSAEPGTIAFPESGGPFEECRPAADPAFEERRRALLERFRERAAAAEGRPGFATAAVEASAGRDAPALWDRLREQLAGPKHSMFFSLPLMGLYLHARDRMPADLKAEVRRVLTRVPVYRGDTENHWVMHYAALLLAAQTWPETPAAEWYAGRTTQELYDEARGWLFHWARLAATRGQGEFDSPNYLFMYVTPMLLLHDFAEEPAVRQLAGMALDLLLADYLAESLDGAWCGGHSRIIDGEVEKTTGNRVSVLHHLYAGGIPLPASIQEWAGFAALSSYRPPSQLAGIANRRDVPYTHRESKRVRNVIRYGAERSPLVGKTTRMTSLWALGSLQGGILQPIQQHTWDVTWRSDAENSTLFAVHPSVSARELAMFFPEEVHDITRTISRQKGSYASPDKLVSASPYERVAQSGNVLAALYTVPEGARFPHVDLYWPDCLSRTRAGGWLLGSDGDFHVAVYATGPGEWIPGDGFSRCRFPGRRLGIAVVVGEPGSALEDLRRSVAGRAPLLREVDGVTTFGYRQVTVTPTWFPDWPGSWLYRGPFVESASGSGLISLGDGGPLRRFLDFNDLTITEKP